MSLKIHAVTIDCHDASTLAQFWADVLMGSVRAAGNGYLAVDHGADGAQHLLFQPVPEERAGKNRMHLDLTTDDPSSDLRRLTELGAVVNEKRSDSMCTWWVLADPEGNVFCLG